LTGLSGPAPGLCIDFLAIEPEGFYRCKPVLSI
jgi:hypothetical protein